MKGVGMLRVLALSTVAGCSSNADVVPEVIKNPATVSGSRIERHGQGELGSEILIKSIDGLELDYSHTQMNYEFNWPVTSGVHEISLELNKLTSDLLARKTVYPPPLLALLEENQAYRLAASYILGSYVAYWLEEVDSGARITPLFYDPPDIPQRILQLARARRPESTTSATSFVPGLFILNPGLSPGDNCLVLIREVRYSKTSLGAGADEAIVPNLLMLAFPGYGANPVYVPTYEVRRYKYEGLEGFCFPAVNGHQYEIRGSIDQHRRKRPKSRSVKVWDKTEARIVGEFKIEDLERLFLLD
jgi:hypothetical protein